MKSSNALSASYQDLSKLLNSHRLPKVSNKPSSEKASSIIYQKLLEAQIWLERRKPLITAGVIEHYHDFYSSTLINTLGMLFTRYMVYGAHDSLLQEKDIQRAIHLCDETIKKLDYQLDCISAEMNHIKKWLSITIDESAKDGSPKTIYDFLIRENEKQNEPEDINQISFSKLVMDKISDPTEYATANKILDYAMNFIHKLNNNLESANKHRQTLYYLRDTYRHVQPTESLSLSDIKATYQLVKKFKKFIVSYSDGMKSIEEKLDAAKIDQFMSRIKIQLEQAVKSKDFDKVCMIMKQCSSFVLTFQKAFTKWDFANTEKNLKVIINKLNKNIFQISKKFKNSSQSLFSYKHLIFCKEEINMCIRKMQKARELIAPVTELLDEAKIIHKQMQKAIMSELERDATNGTPLTAKEITTNLAAYSIWNKGRKIVTLNSLLGRYENFRNQTFLPLVVSTLNNFLCFINNQPNLIRSIKNLFFSIEKIEFSALQREVMEVFAEQQDILLKLLRPLVAEKITHRDKAVEFLNLVKPSTNIVLNSNVAVFSIPSLTSILTNKLNSARTQATSLNKELELFAKRIITDLETCDYLMGLFADLSTFKPDAKETGMLKLLFNFAVDANNACYQLGQITSQFEQIDVEFGKKLQNKLKKIAKSFAKDAVPSDAKSTLENLAQQCSQIITKIDKTIATEEINKSKQVVHFLIEECKKSLSMLENSKKKYYKDDLTILYFSVSYIKLLTDELNNKYKPFIQMDNLKKEAIKILKDVEEAQLFLEKLTANRAAESKTEETSESNHLAL